MAESVQRVRTGSKGLRESEKQYRLLFRKNPHPMWIADRKTLAFLAVNEAAVRHYGYSEAAFRSMTIRDIRPPEDVPALLKFRARSDRAPGAADLGPAGVWRHRKKDGSIIDVEITRSRISFEGKDAILVLAHDITASRRTEQALLASQRELEKRVRERTAALRRTEATNRAILKALPDLVFRIGRDGTYLDFAGAKDFPTYVPPSQFMGKTVLQTLPPELARRCMEGIERAFESGETQVFEYQLPVEGEPRDYEARIAVSRPKEVLVIVRDISGRKQAEGELQALTARLLAAEEDQRRYVARELHDHLNQRLAALAIDAGLLRQQLPDSPDDIRRRLQGFESRVSELSEEVHRLAYQLHPSILDHLGLAVALESYCVEFSRREGIQARFIRRHPPDAIPRQVASCLYRVTQEALRNVAKHARAKRVTVALEGSGDGLLLSIRDSGAGFSPQQVRGRGGLGILSMEERVRQVSGSISIHSRPGRGARIEARVPLPARPA